MAAWPLLLAAALAAGEVAPPPPLPRLITADSLEALLRHGPVTVVDVREEWTAYLEGHIPGAAWAHVESFRAWGGGLPFQLLSAAEYARLFDRLGVRPDRPVVLYSQGEGRNIDATFVAWILASLGHRHVSVLDGGWFGWAVEHRPVDRGYPAAAPGRFPERPLRAPTVSLAELRAAMGRPGVVLVDARSEEQFAGRAGAQRRRGHIPGAVNHPWASDLERRDFGPRWKSLAALRASYETQGITPDRDVIVYCNTGTEASHVWFALAALLGYPRVRIYAGAWSEWAARDDLPVATAQP